VICVELRHFYVETFFTSTQDNGLVISGLTTSMSQMSK